LIELWLKPFLADYSAAFVYQRPVVMITGVETKFLGRVRDPAKRWWQMRENEREVRATGIVTSGVVTLGMKSTSVASRPTSTAVFEVSCVEGETEHFAKAGVGARVHLVSASKGAYVSENETIVFA
jgi:hypothetical protein